MLRNPIKDLWHRERPEVDQARVDQVDRMLERAGPSTLAECTQILAIAIIHELPHHTGHSGAKIAAQFVQQYKRPGWVPPALELAADTPVEMVRMPDVSHRQQSDVNRHLAEELVRLAPDAALESASAIGFSGSNTALGQTFFAILAT